MTGCPANCLACATGSPRYAPAERKPSAGWVERVDTRGAYTLTTRTLYDASGRFLASASSYAGEAAEWAVYAAADQKEKAGTAGRAPTIEAAQLAAEDTLLEIASAIVGAVRR